MYQRKKRPKGNTLSILNWRKMKTQYIQMYGMLLKQSLGKFIALNACIRKEDNSQINDLS